MTKTFTTTCTALVLVAFLGACGSDDGSDDGSGSGSGESAEGGQDGQELYDWVDCMAGEGIELPEPSKDADGNLVIEGDGVDLSLDSPGEPNLGAYSEEEFFAGTDVCGHPPLQSGMSEESLQEQSDNALAHSECMRENGVESFPDPEESPVESEAESGESMQSMHDPAAMEGVESDPEFEAANEACQDVMFGDGEGSE